MTTNTNIEIMEIVALSLDHNKFYTPAQIEMMLEDNDAVDASMIVKKLECKIAVLFSEDLDENGNSMKPIRCFSMKGFLNTCMLRGEMINNAEQYA